MSGYQEIMAQIAQLQMQAAQARKAEVAAVIKEIKSKIAEFGLTADDLGLSAKQPSGRNKGRIKYTDPATGKGWSGFGKPPNWIKQYEAAGRQRDEFLA